MGLYSRIVGEESPKIPVHQFMALLSERPRGAITREEIISLLSLDVGESIELDDILDKSDALATDRRFEFARMMHDIMLLSESGLKYMTSTDFYDRINTFV